MTQDQKRRVQAPLKPLEEEQKYSRRRAETIKSMEQPQLAEICDRLFLRI